jgi:hypothetical protein
MPEIEILRKKNDIFCSRQDDNVTNHMGQIPWAEMNESGQDATPGPPDYAPNFPPVFCIWECRSEATACCYRQQEQWHSLFLSSRPQIETYFRKNVTAEWVLLLPCIRMSWFRISCRRPTLLKLSELFLSLSKEMAVKYLNWWNNLPFIRPLNFIYLSYWGSRWPFKDRDRPGKVKLLLALVSSSSWFQDSLPYCIL